MAPLNPIWLEDFLALAATVNFSRAAEARAITQPAFSRRIRALDHDFVSAIVGHDALLPVSVPTGRGRGAKALHRLDSDAAHGVPVLAFSAASGLGRIVAALRGRTFGKVAERVVFTAHLATVLRSMALDGRGVAWLPQSLIDADLKARRLVLAAPPSWRIPLDIRIFRSEVSHAPAAQAFWYAITSLDTPDADAKPPSRRRAAPSSKRAGRP